MVMRRYIGGGTPVGNAGGKGGTGLGELQCGRGGGITKVGLLYEVNDEGLGKGREKGE